MTIESSPLGDLAEGFAAMVARWARRRGCAPADERTLGELAQRMSLALGEGHVCLPLEEIATRIGRGVDEAALRALVERCGLAGTPQEPGAKPFVLDADGRLYLHRYFDYERRLAHRLLRAANAAPLDIPASATERLRAAFPVRGGAGGVDWQMIAAALALRRRLTVISGGPGTGKTATVVQLLACLIEQEPECRVVLAAPTGKAAARMTEAIRQRAVDLPQALRERLPSGAFTVHRLLGAAGDAGFAHHAGRPLALDALIVDEASMLDLALAVKLLEAVPDNARVVLLGDKDQLAAVESGAVFAEIGADPSLGEQCREALARACGIDAAAIAPRAAANGAAVPALRDSVVWFDRNFRFAGDSGIGRLAADINAGRADEVLAWLREGSDQGVRWVDAGRADGDAQVLQCLHDGLAPYIDAIRRDPRDAGAAFDALQAFRVLCATREGPRGMLSVNERMEAQARRALGGLAAQLSGEPPGRDSPWYVGRPVMLLRNDYALRLFNGDVGIALPDADGKLLLHFANPQGGWRIVSPARLPEHQTAFAMTVHKAQGSEFGAVLVLLPQTRSGVVTRELLYTAVTRARERVTLVADAPGVSAAIASRTRRHSGLAARLSDEQQRGPTG